MTKFLIGFFVGSVTVALVMNYSYEKMHNYNVILNDGDTLIIPSKVTGYVGLTKTITTKPDSTVFDTLQYNHHIQGKSNIRQKHWSLYSVKCNEDSHALDTSWDNRGRILTFDTSTRLIFQNRFIVSDSFNNQILGDTPIANMWIDSAAFRMPLKRKKHQKYKVIP